MSMPNPQIVTDPLKVIFYEYFETSSNKILILHVTHILCIDISDLLITIDFDFMFRLQVYIDISQYTQMRVHLYLISNDDLNG